MLERMTWYVPSFHGDIKLESKGAEETLVTVYDLTPQEEEAMRALRASSLKFGWAKEADFLPLTSSAYRTSAKTEVTLKTGLPAVEDVLTRSHRAGRELIKVLKLGGEISEVRKVPELAKENFSFFSGWEEAAAKGKKGKEAKGATVAQPNKGCPMPDFPQADIRAARVLEEFLTPEQVRDYRRDGAFVSRGTDTGHRYLVCSRDRPEFMKTHMSLRQLFDLDANVAVCVHDWAVPPAEEMLALHLCLTLPGRESAMLLLPEMSLERALADVDRRYWPRG